MTRSAAPARLNPLWALPLLASLLPQALRAQEPQPDTLARVVGRPVAELVANLSGLPVSLQELVAVAQERNVALDVARAQRRLAEAGVDVEGGLFDPDVSLGWATAKSDTGTNRTNNWSAGLSQALPWGTRLGLGLDTYDMGQSGTGAGDYQSNLALTLRQPLLEGLGVLDADLRAARALREAAAGDLARSRENTVALVELGYWDLAETEAIQAVLQRSLEIAEALLFRNRQLAERELIPEVDVLTARSGVALRRAGFISARQDRLDASEALVFLAWGGQAGERLAQDTLPMKTEGYRATIPDSWSEGLPRLEALAMESRGDVVAARKAMEAARESRRAARRGVLPTLNLDASVDSWSQGSSLSGALGKLELDRSWSLGFSFSHPLFNRTDRGVSRQADLTLELRQLELLLVENRVRLEVRSTLRAMEAGQERLAAAEEAASLARAQLEAERRRLELGLGDSFRLLETEENAVQAELEEVRARFDLARATTLYRLALGEVLGS